jgi:hypothetical protein
LLGCEQKPEVSRPRATSSAIPSGPSPGARAVASLVASVRSRELRLAAPGWQLQPLAFGRNLFVRLAGERVEAYSMPSGAPLFEHPMRDLRGVVEIAGGSVVVVAQAASLRIDPRAKEPVRLPALSFLPGTVLIPDRSDSSGLWSVHTAGRVLARQVLDISGKRKLDRVIPLTDYDGGPVTAMRDGALVYRAAKGVRRAQPGGRARALATDFVPWRLVPARRVDQLWAIAEDGKVELWQVGDRIATTTRATLGAPPFDVAASSEYLAAVVVEEGTGAPRRFRLVVLSDQGEVMRMELATDTPPEGERWAALAGRDRYVALAETEPLVAVGGPGSVKVFAIPDGRIVLAR